MKTICTVYGESAVIDRTCQKWFVKFRAGDFSLDDVPRSGRPVEVDSNQIETLIENNQHYTMCKIADILRISKSIKLLVGMKNVLFILWKKLSGLFVQHNILTGSLALWLMKTDTIPIHLFVGWLVESFVPSCTSTHSATRVILLPEYSLYSSALSCPPDLSPQSIL